jgi:septum formation protein
VVLTDQSRQESISIFTEVVLDPLTETEIRYYIKKYKPFDKAGAYAIQEWIGIQKIRSISGCYYNVVGLPLSNLSALLADFGIYPILE